MTTLTVVPYSVENNEILTFCQIDYKMNEYEFGVQMAASRVITEWLRIKIYTQEEWDNLREIYDKPTRAVMAHVTYFSHHASDSLIYVPINIQLEGVQNIQTPVRNEEILIQNFYLANQYNLLEKAIRNEEISYPLPAIYDNPDYAAFNFFVENPIYGFGEAWSTSIFSKPFEKWQNYYILSGQLPSDTALQTIKGIVVLGGKYSANDQEEWLINLKAFLRRIYNDYPNIKLVGICLGAQIIANVLGGTVEKIPNKYIFKYDTIITTSEFKSLYPNLRNQYIIAENHGENIVQLPDFCERWGYSENSPNEIFGISRKLMCLQSHPNYVGKFCESLVIPFMLANTSILTKEEADQMILDQNSYRSHTAEILCLIKDFLKS
ncbi:unnamed protein product [Blepharisma stoltei]|uniref:Glutamine amidotransferase domain-containing protein n=1 Tax=Blepharisma stoltei TaxID=1481888 RepID=A0AAU9IYS7_9CILI|nr:unnamed protein product [Blepharisma stoltei]